MQSDTNTDPAASGAGGAGGAGGGGGGGGVIASPCASKESRSVGYLEEGKKKRRRRSGKKNTFDTHQNDAAEN